MMGKNSKLVPALVAAVLVVASTGAYFAFSGLPGRAKHKSHHGVDAASGSGGKKGPTAKQVEYASLNYPSSSGRLPESIKSSYDPVKNRTQMTLSLRNLSVASSGNFKAQGVEIRLASEFKGQTRPAEKAESSIDGVITTRSNIAGLLATSSPPGIVTADGQALSTREASKKHSGYTSTKAGDGTTESVVFKIDTKDLLTVAAASSVRARFGLLEVILSPAQIADLREFTARLNPGPGAAASGG
jgi:hypothetical protein